MEKDSEIELLKTKLAAAERSWHTAQTALNERGKRCNQNPGFMKKLQRPISEIRLKVCSRGFIVLRNCSLRVLISWTMTSVCECRSIVFRIWSSSVSIFLQSFLEHFFSSALSKTGKIYPFHLATTCARSLCLISRKTPYFSLQKLRQPELGELQVEGEHGGHGKKENGIGEPEWVFMTFSGRHWRSR